MFIKLFKGSLLFLFILAIFLFYTNNFIVNSTAKQIKEISETNSSDVWIVFWAAVYWDKVSDIYSDRLKTALKAYKQWKIDKILISADNQNEDYDEITPAKNFLVFSWVEEDDIYLDKFWVDTYDSIYRAVNIYGITNLTLFTQKYHLNRAIFICNSFKITCQWISTDLQIYLQIRKYESREILSRIKALLNVVFKSKPKYI